MPSRSSTLVVASSDASVHEACLTPRQRQTLALLLAGRSTKEIADDLGISPHTATDHTKAIFRQFGVGSRAALLAHLWHEKLGRGEVSSTAVPVELAPRQRQTLELLLAGQSAKEIAERLGISRHTASQYTKAILRRFGVGSRTALLARVARGDEHQAVPPLLGR